MHTQLKTNLVLLGGMILSALTGFLTGALIYSFNPTKKIIISYAKEMSLSQLVLTAKIIPIIVFLITFLIFLKWMKLKKYF